MENLNTIQQKLLYFHEDLFKTYPIKRLAIFGCYAGNEATPKSDVDIVVEFTKPIGFQFFELAEDLEKYIGKKIDLVSKKGIKQKYFELIENELIDV